MIIVELAFETTDERLLARPAHRALLGPLCDRKVLLAAGPWVDDSGAMLVFTASRAHVDEVLDSDPYYRTPGVRIVAVREWSPTVGVLAIAAPTREGD